MTLIVGLIIALAAIAFAVANRAPVTIELWPLPYTYEVPIFAMAFTGLGAGVLIGMIAAWSLGRSRRRRAGARASPPAS